MNFFSRYKTSFFEYFRYCIVGISCAILDLAALNGLLYFFPTEKTAMLTLYNSAAYGLAVLNSYIWNSKFTFQVKKTKKQFIAFIVQALICLLIANLIFLLGLWLFSLFSDFPKWIETNVSKAISMYLSSTASFLFNKFIVFRKKRVIKEN